MEWDGILMGLGFMKSYLGVLGIKKDTNDDIFLTPTPTVCKPLQHQYHPIGHHR